MRISRSLAAAIAVAATTTGAFASPLMIGPPVAPTVAPKAISMSAISVAPMQKQALASYKQLRAFWLSRAIVR